MTLKKSLFTAGFAVLVLIFFLFNKGETSIKKIVSKNKEKQQIELTNDSLTNSYYKEEKQDDSESYAQPVSLITKTPQEEEQNALTKISNSEQKNKINNNEKNTKQINKSNNSDEKIKSVIPEKDTKSEKKVISTKTNYSKNVINSGSHFYGKANVYIGYESRHSNYNVFSEIGIKNEYTNASNSLSKTDKNISGVLIFNYNLYYKLSNLIHPFIGIDIMAKYPFSLKNDFNFNVNNDNIDDISGYYNVNITDSVKINEYGRLNAKLGTKINLHKNISIDPYALAGFNVTGNFSLSSKVNGEYRSKKSSSTRYEITREASFYDGKTRINFVYGGGVDVVLFDKYIVGMEYYNYRVNTCNTLVYEGGYKDFSLKTKREKFVNHNFLVKFGIRF